MKKVKILVVEDEIIIADNLCDTLEELGYEIIEPALNYTEALIQIKNEQPDIAILDIELGGSKTGIDLAQKIKDEYDFPFIFLTSNSDPITLNKAKKVMPPAYLVKPFTKEELYTSIEVALYNFSKKNDEITDSNFVLKDALFIKDQGVFKKILFKDILYLKSSHVYTDIVLLNEQTHVARVSLNSIINNLNSKFIRVHRSYIVNTEYLSQVNKTSIKLNNELIPIGTKFKDELLKNLNLI